MDSQEWPQRGKLANKGQSGVIFTQWILERVESHVVFPCPPSLHLPILQVQVWMTVSCRPHLDAILNLIQKNPAEILKDEGRRKIRNSKM